MNRTEAAYYLRSDQDDIDYLRDVPMGVCPYCRKQMVKTTEGDDNICTNLRCDSDPYLSEIENRARYQEEREADALVNEQVNCEASRGKEPPY